MSAHSTSAHVRNTARPGIRSLSTRWLKGIAVVTALAVLPVVGIVGTPTPQAAFAADYPSWQDVQAAVADVNAANALKTQIEAQLAALEAQVQQTQADSEAKGQAYYDAQTAYDEQTVTTQQLQTQADDAKAESDAAQKTADRLIAELAKPGGGNLTADLIAQPGKSDDMLYKWGAMSKLSESSNNIYTRASQLQGTAQSLTDQAAEAQKELDRRKVIAEEAFAAAQAAALAAQDALDAEEEHKAELEAQIVVLNERRASHR